MEQSGFKPARAFILFLKATQGNLFEELVPVKGHTNEQGTYVKPHYARRRKAHKKPKKPKHGTHGRPGEQRKEEAPREPDLFDQPERAQPLEPKQPPSGQPGGAEDIFPDSNATTRAEMRKVLGVGLDYTQPFSKLDIPEFGSPAGSGKPERRRLNDKAIDTLKEVQSGAKLTPERQASLAKYSGRGGCGDSLNEFYTRPDVAAAMWRAMSALGVRDGNVLEPSCGTGVFLTTQPKDVNVEGVEMDETASGIARALHPASTVFRDPLEYWATQDTNQYAGVIGNAPFGLRGSLIKADKKHLKTAEQYFLDTAIDKTKPGGVVAMIVPTGIMDGKNARAYRARLLGKAEFLGAMRMPNTAFERSHTEVTTDVVFFRKRAQDVANAMQAVNEKMARDLGIRDDEFVNGHYFEGRGAANVLGRTEAGWREKAGMGHDITVEGSMDGVAERIAAFKPEKPLTESPSVQDMVAAAGDDEKLANRITNAALKAPYEVAKVGDTKIVDGVTYQLTGEPPRWRRLDEAEPEAPEVSAGKELAAKIEAYLAAPPAEQTAQRESITTALDAYVAEHGNPAKSKALREAAGQDKALWRLIGAVHTNGEYSDAVRGRMAHVADTGDFDQVAQKLIIQRGGFTAEDLAAVWTNGDAEAAEDRLFASPEYAIGADGKTWQTMDAYLSGDLWPKLDGARGMLEHKGLTGLYQKQYEAQIEALEKAIDPQSIEDVEIAMASGWLPTEVLEAYWNSRIDAWKSENPGASWNPEPYKIDYADGLYTVTGGMFEAKLLGNYLNRLTVKKDDWPRIDEWNKQFKEWLAGSDYREEVESLYNRKYRGFVQRHYSEDPMDVAGLTSEKTVNPYIWVGVRWALGAGKGIVAADVGLGKTAEALILAKVAKEQGQCEKPLFVVPKSVLANWAAEAEMWFPGSSVLTIGESYTRDKNGELKAKADSKAERDRKLHELAQNDYDFVLMSQPAWNDIDIDPDTKADYIEGDFWVQRADQLDKATGKKIEKMRAKYNQQTGEREFEKRTDVLYFNDLGVDMLLFDEMHAYKNMFSARNRRGFSPKFLGGSGQSNRAFDTNLKARWLRENNDGKNVYGLTATPTKNSPLEIYSMLSHIAPEEFEARGIRNSEDFIDRYCEFKEKKFLGTNGELDTGLVTVGFKNLDELRELMGQYIDRKTAEDVGLKLPERQDHRHMIDMTPDQELAYQGLRERAENARDGDSGDSHIFAIMDKMGKASIDLDLLDGAPRGTPSPKIIACAKEAASRVSAGGQLIFAEHVDVHGKIVDKLVKAGVPREQIAVCNGKTANTGAKRQNICDKFNAGKIKVVVGNRVMEEGMNLQKRTSDIHHLELPWEPASLQQRNGRGLRQGNTNKGVDIHTYLAKGSFDGYRYQTIGAKADWQDLLWNGGNHVENLAQESAGTADELMIMLSADPEAARKKYEENTAEAAKRSAAKARRSGAERFGQLSKMRESYARLKNKDSQSAQRLQTKIEVTTQKLRDDPHFLAKEALDSDTPAIIQPETGRAWKAGDAFVMPAGEKAPLYVSDEPVKMVVTGIDRDSGHVKMRQYGHFETSPKFVNLDKLDGAYDHYDYSPGDEVKVAVETDGAISGPLSIKGLPKEAVARNYQAVQESVKAGVRGYKDHAYRAGSYGLIDARGKPLLAASYETQHRLDDNDLMLPIPDHREKAIDGYMAAARARNLRERMPGAGPPGRGLGVTVNWSNVPGVGYASQDTIENPWTRPMNALFGAGAIQEARQRLAGEQLEAIGASKTFGAALAAALPTAEVGTTGNLRFPKEILNAMKKAAKRDGVNDKRMTYTHGTGHIRGAYNADQTVENWLANMEVV